MNRTDAERLLSVFEQAFDENKFTLFLKDLLKNFQPIESQLYLKDSIPERFQPHIYSLKIIGKYSYGGKKIDLLIVKLKKSTSLERARTAQRNFIEWYLKENEKIEIKDAALVAFESPENKDWRFSLVKMNYFFEEFDGEVKIKEKATSARRWSFLVGENQNIHTAKSRFIPILENDQMPKLEDLENAFNVEPVTEEFFDAYKYALNEIIIKSLPNDISLDKRSFAQLLLSRILFVYFLQKKGWLQDRKYLKNFWLKYLDWKKSTKSKDVFYSRWLSSLFFGAFNKKQHLISEGIPDDIKESLKLMPFLDGGLFSKTKLDKDVNIPDSVFEWLFESDPNDNRKGFLEIYNFTIDESTPLDVEVAVDPEMLGKVYESLILEDEREESGIFYTPRIEIDLMTRLSLVEYLTKETKIQKEKITDFVFNTDDNKLSEEELENISDKLDRLKVVDPAVGSGSFLVAMLNILVELHSKLNRDLEGKENLFALKEKIICENIYGVDVKYWAVMVAELRLWLSLIVETGEQYMDYTKPLLPNLSFKIRQGDSLIEEIAGVYITLKNENKMPSLPPSIRVKIEKLVEKKERFFVGSRDDDLKEERDIEMFEQEIFKEIVQFKIEQTEKEIQSLSSNIESLKKSRSLFEKENPQIENQIKEKKENKIKEIEEKISLYNNNITKYKNIYSEIGKKAEKDYFLWEVDFIEIFAEKGGFDIVIGNPPYVRQELIAPPLENQKNYNGKEWSELKKEYKNKLIQSAKNEWDNLAKIDRTSDLYVYFYYKGLSLLKSDGVFCFISSNSWLDVNYGTKLQEFLLKNMEPLLIIDNLKKRSFKEADINTVIVLIRKPENPLKDYTLKFVAFKKPFEDVSNPYVIKKIEAINEPNFNDEDFRLYPKTKKDLLLEGTEFDGNDESNFGQNLEDLPYIGNKWGGKYLRAPEIYFKILEKGKGKLVRLGDIAEVKFGIKTGANEFFYLKPVGKTVKEVAEIAGNNPNVLIEVKNDVGWKGEIEARFLKPVIKSPKELKTIVVKIEDLNYLAFMCHDSKSQLKGTKALEYIKWGEKQGYQNKPTCKSRKPWWDLRESEISTALWTMTYGERFFVVFNKAAFADARFYDIYCNENTVFILNSTYCLFWIELSARGYGGGAADVKVYEVNQILIPKLDNFEIKGKIDFSNKSFINTIFAELGFDPSKPIRDQEPNPMPDRQALDNIIFDALGLTEEERKEVYWAVAELVKNRLEKANRAV
ncbi:Eco57I restriction-modification methylase domain-containing protein [Athalassotoga saccharophila]|uniref:Eco57I restriction-modification methylase domain-containing protein n=1 Tax=Athalassotoga saccharophila TaxID=1441386 RepID=UPI00137B5BD4|nr:DNA methyltransferase [Athalassotoga saccharophila]BBJ28539.1 modification methylase PaeR7I [Athalassotoga saccharophila]